MGVLKILKDGLWIPLSGYSTVIYGGGGAYDVALLEVVSNGQQNFTIPDHGGATRTYCTLNGVAYTSHEGDYIISGNTLIWVDNQLETGEKLLFYHIPLEE